MVLPSKRLLIAEAILRVELAFTTTFATRLVWRVRLQKTAEENEEKVRKKFERGSMRLYSRSRGSTGGVGSLQNPICWRKKC